MKWKDKHTNAKPFTGLIKGLRARTEYHVYETEKITRKASDAAEHIELFGSFTRDPHARRIITGFTGNFIFVRRKRLQIYASGMTISSERTEQHVVIGFGELAAVD